ncbi:uncharacterized protein [Ptychodera flava]|uniref:uncharacterized protein n=1 Tax=Ptychodera flava TaxID=63121 RepID=UPI00396A5A06
MASADCAFRDGTGRRDSKCPPPAALVVCSHIGSPITGGVAAAIHQLIFFLHSIGLDIYCTAFGVNNDKQNDLHKFEVSIIYPDPPDLYRLKQEDISWLHSYEIYFPGICKIKNVKMVFCFGLVTTYPARALKQKEFPGASFYLVNPYTFETPLKILGYGEADYKIWKRSLLESSKEANAVFSIGSEIFEHFDFEYQYFDPEVKHYSLRLTPDDALFKQKAPSKIPQSGKFQIVMFVDENDVTFLTSESIVAKALNFMAESFHNVCKETPKLTIITMNKGLEDDIKNSLNPNPQLEIKYRSFVGTEVVSELRRSHLLLVPPSSFNSINLSLSTIALGIPVMIPLHSACHKQIKEYLPYFESDVAVDMKSSHIVLGQKIMDAVVNFPKYLYRAQQMRRSLELKSAEVSERTKEMICEIISESEGLCLPISPGDDNPRRSTGEQAKDEDRRRESSEDTSAKSENDFNTNSERQERRPGQLRVRLSVREGAPDGGRSMDEVEEDLFRHASTQTNAEDFGREMTTLDPGLYGVDIKKGCLFFVMRCESPEAADALWAAYKSGRLDRMADKIFLSIPILNDIGARRLSLETFMDFQEYLLCKEEITERERKRLLERQQEADIEVLRHRNQEMNNDKHQHCVNICLREQNLKDKQTLRDQLQSAFVGDGQAYREEQSTTFHEWLSLKNEVREFFNKVGLVKAKEMLSVKINALDSKLTLQMERKNSTLLEIADLNLAKARIEKGLPKKGTIWTVPSQKKPGGLQTPIGLTVKQNGQVVVTDRGPVEEQGSVHTLSEKFQPVSVMTFYSLPLPFKPWDVAVAGKIHTTSLTEITIVFSSAIETDNCLR